jgi:uncharacterized protein (DUF362 family)
VKPNFNTADPAPASTHKDTLSQIIIELQNQGVRDITLAERSFQSFAEVISIKNIDRMATELGFKILNLNYAEKSRFTHEKMNWQNGFDFPQIINNSDYMVCTGCLKTHSSGGIYTMSLKLSVGPLPTLQMDKLHGSPVMRYLISEINLAYKPNLIIMDGVDVFISGGPSVGTLKSSGVMIAGIDRVAIDAVGLVVLKEQGSYQVSGKIFDQDQMVRAVELGLGIRSANQIQLITADETSRQYANKLQIILGQG